MNGADAFEKKLKETMESYELPYNSADWTEMERQLDNKKRGAWKLGAGMLSLLLVSTVVLSTVVYFVVRNDEAPAQMMADATDQLKPNAAGDQGTIPATLPAETQEQPAITTTTSTDVQSPRTNTSNSQRTTGITRNTEPASANTTSAISTTEISITPSVTMGCPGTVVEFAATNLPKEGTFLWNFGDGSFSRDAEPRHTFAKAGQFEVMLSHSSVGGGMTPEPVSNVIVIHETPEAVFNYVPQDYENTVPSIHFENRSIGGKSYLWDFGDGSTSTVAHPNHVYKKMGNYAVSLTVTNGGGCTDRTEKTVKVSSDYNLLAAATFSPDGDGVEDSFIPEALKTLGVRFHMTVQDPATGQLIFETSDAQRPWNGRIGGRGEACTSGDYVWMVEMKDGDKLGGTYNGTVSLVR